MAITLIALFIWSLADLGRLVFQMVRRWTEARTGLPAIARRIAEHHGRPEDLLQGVAVSASLRSFWQQVESRVHAAGSR